MKVRLGYVSISLNLPKISSSSNVTYSYYNKLATEPEKLQKLITVTRSNLDDLYTILKYNKNKQISFYRITSSLIPLATHPEVFNWNFRELFYDYFNFIGEYIKLNNFRVDTHPNEFNVINSINDTTVKNTIRNLMFHANLFEDLKYENGKMILHVGGKQDGIAKASIRFIENFNTIPQSIKSKIILENDDKSFTATDTLKICNSLNIPMVLDIHHFKCNNNNESLIEILNNFFETWENQPFPAKIHYSSPRNHKLDRKHADYINPIEFVNFIKLCSSLGYDNLDVMLEAKNKDLALFKLAKDIKILKPNWKWLDNSTFLV